MTWKELKELIEQMSPEEQNAKVIVWDRDEFPKSVNSLLNQDENVYKSWLNIYFESDLKERNSNELRLVLKEGEYYLNV